MRVQTFRLGRPALLLGALALHGIASAQGAAEPDPDIDAGLHEIQRQTGEIADGLPGKTMPAWLRGAGVTADGFANEAASIAKQAAAILACEQGGQICPAPAEGARHDGSIGGMTPDITFTLFASRSLSDGQLRDIFVFAAGAEDTRILFRGIAEDASLLDFIASLKPLLEDIDPPPTVLLDPTPFREQGITAVPTLVAIGPDGRELARVAGLASTRWLRAALAAGQRGDLGTRAPVREIAEPDLLETIHRRLARIDFARLGARAAERAFDNLRFEPLPAAGEDRERLIDPSITATGDIRLPDGTLLVRAGDSVNPLERLPFTQRLVVFDAADGRQLAFAGELASAASARPTIFLLTGLLQQGGWAELERVMDRLERRVYLLTPELRQRFALERVPAVVEAAGQRFRVTEHAMVGQVAAEAAP